MGRALGPKKSVSDLFHISGIKKDLQLVGKLTTGLFYAPNFSLLVMLYCLSQASSWSWSSLTLPVVPEDFLVSVGVIIFSYTSQIFLPPLEGSMEDRGQFNAMLGWTHGTACIMKTSFSLLVSESVFVCLLCFFLCFSQICASVTFIEIDDRL